MSDPFLTSEDANATTDSQMTLATGEAADFLHPPQAPDEIGRLGNYRILKVLGAGGMGIVYLAEDAKLKRRLAIKAMKPALAASASAGERFLREAQTTASIKHPNIVTIYQVDQDRGVPFIAMELLEGESLEDRLRRDKKLSVAETVRIGREIALGLAEAHKKGLIHRDIKPGNIWLEGPDAQVKILDFGLAHGAEEELHVGKEPMVAGTPAYMAPEQARAENLDARSDLFSLGCVLYRACTGTFPFPGKRVSAVLAAVKEKDAAPPRQLSPDIPGWLSDLIVAMLAKEPAHRPASALVVVDAFNTGLYDRYVERLVRVAQDGLSSKLAGEVNSEDVVKSVLRSFHRRVQEDRSIFKESDAVWKMLVEITIQKTMQRIDAHHGGQGVPGPEATVTQVRRAVPPPRLNQEPTQEEAALFVDELERFLQQLRPEDRKIVEMRLAGFDNAEIAAKLRVSDRSIRRLMEFMQGQAQKA